ncbi:MAG: hypothetical protein SGBAC_009884 [Bacillariaceae sp.]
MVPHFLILQLMMLLWQSDAQSPSSLWTDDDGCVVVTAKKEELMAFLQRVGPIPGEYCGPSTGLVSFNPLINTSSDVQQGCSLMEMCYYEWDCDYTDYTEMCGMETDDNAIQESRNCVVVPIKARIANGKSFDRSEMCQPDLADLNTSRRPSWSISQAPSLAPSLAPLHPVAPSITWTDEDSCVVATPKKEELMAFLRRVGPVSGEYCGPETGTETFNPGVTAPAMDLSQGCTIEEMCYFKWDCDYTDYTEMCGKETDDNAIEESRNCVVVPIKARIANGKSYDRSEMCQPDLTALNTSPPPSHTPSEGGEEQASDESGEIRNWHMKWQLFVLLLFVVIH